MAINAKNKCTQSETEVYVCFLILITFQVPCSIPKEVIFSVAKI